MQADVVNAGPVIHAIMLLSIITDLVFAKQSCHAVLGMYDVQ